MKLKGRLEESITPDKMEVMRGQSKICIEKWETLKVKSSVNIRLCAVEGNRS